MFDRNTYTGMDPRPDDFEAFWADQVAQLASLTKVVIPAASICPEVMPRYNSWKSPTN